MDFLGPGFYVNLIPYSSLGQKLIIVVWATLDDQYVYVNIQLTRLLTKSERPTLFTLQI